MKFLKVTREAVAKLNPRLVERIERAVERSPSHHCHVAVTLDSRGNPIALGVNRWEAHAEFNSITKHFSVPKFYGKGLAALLVVRVAKGGAWSNSRPCMKCQKLLSNLSGITVMHS